VLVVGGVEHARGEDHDRGVAGAVGCGGPERVEQQAGVVGHGTYVELSNDSGKTVVMARRVRDDVRDAGRHADVVLQHAERPVSSRIRSMPET